MIVPLYSQVSCSTMPNILRRSLAGEIADVVAVDQDGAAVDVVEAHQQLDHGGLAGAGRADDGDLLAGFDRGARNR